MPPIRAVRTVRATKMNLSWKETMSNLKTAKCILLAGVASFAFAHAANAQTLDQALIEAKQSTAASAAAQRQVENLDDQAGDAQREYSALLQRRDSLDIFVKRQELYLESQTDEIASLREQLNTVEQTKQDLVPMMIRMAVDLRNEIKNDYPFNLENRLAAVDRVMANLSDPAVAPVEQYRQILTAYQNEVTYGQGVNSYEGPHPDDAKRTVDYLRFGRVAFVYMTKDESEIKFYDLESKGWVEVDSGLALQMRQAIRMANDEATQSIVSIPVKLK